MFAESSGSVCSCCDLSCKSCADSSDNCILCWGDDTLSNGSCLCAEGYRNLRTHECVQECATGEVPDESTKTCIYMREPDLGRFEALAELGPNFTNIATDSRVTFDTSCHPP
jgi:hypothetical protein